MRGSGSWIFCAWAALVSVGVACGQGSPRLVVIDQDGSGPGGSNQMAMMVLLQSAQAKVLGITEVSGNAWEPEEVAHTLRMLELIHRTDVPVVPGAVFPLLRTETEAKLERPLVGSYAWYGAWGDLAAGTSSEAYHEAFVVPALVEGSPTTKPLEEDAAHFLVRQVRAHPHAVWIYAAGPLTNIALALSLEPRFAELSAGIVIMGGSFSPRTDDPEFANHPRHEFNFWFDPEAAHVVLRAHWPRVDLTSTDVSVQVRFTQAMVAEIAQSAQPAAQYIAKYSQDPYYLWDELAAAAWLEPSLITEDRLLYVDVDLERGVNYGDTLSWSAADRPATVLYPVHVQLGVDAERFYQFFMGLMKMPPLR